MFNISKHSKVILAAGAFAFAAFYSVSGYAQVGPLAGLAQSAPLPTKIDDSKFNTPISNLKNAANAQDSMADYKEKLAAIDEEYKSDIQSLTDEISKGTVYDPETGKERKMKSKEKKALQEKLANLKKEYAQKQSEAATSYNQALSDYKSSSQAAASNVSVDAKRGAYNQARDEYNKLAQCVNAPADCQDASGKPYDTNTLNAALAEKKAAADAAYSDYRNEQDLLNNKRSQLQQDVRDAQNEVTSLESKLQDAQAGCDYYKQNGAVSKAAKADQEKYCGLVDSYTQQLEAAKTKLAAAKSSASASTGSVDEHEGEVYAAFSTATDSGVDADGNFTGKYRGDATYTDTSGNIFNTLTRRAMLIIVSLKPIVYVLAGFGLIGFAFMAIFNKISWKWFSNIAIGLFLVANMGRFIEYFVYKDAGKSGGWEVSTQPLSYGDYLNKGFADTKYEWVDASVFYTPSRQLEGEIPSADVMSVEDEAKTRGFCGKTEGASGWANFSSCIKDITSTVKKGVDTAKQAKATVDKVKNGVESVKNAAKNIGNAIEAAKGGGLSGMIDAAGKIGSNVNNMISTTGNVVNGVTTNISGISNNVQDLGKSTDQVAELNEKRAKGEGTNALDRFLKGQTTGADGEVERLYGGTDQNGKAKAGDIAKDSNIVGKILDTTGNITQKSKEANSNLQSLTKAGSEGAKIVEDATGITKKLQDKKRQKTQQAVSGANSPLVSGDNKNNNGGTNKPLATGDDGNAADNGGTNKPLATGDDGNAADNGGTNKPLATGNDGNAADNGGTNKPLATGDDGNAADNGGSNQPLTRSMAAPNAPVPITASAPVAAGENVPVKAAAPRSAAAEVPAADIPAPVVETPAPRSAAPNTAPVASAPVAAANANAPVKTAAPRPETVEVPVVPAEKASVPSNDKNNPVVVAQNAVEEVTRVEQQVREAEEVAASKQEAAAAAQTRAAEARARAQETGNPADVRAAERAETLAELAQKEAETAAEAAEAAAEPLEELKEKAKTATVAESKYKQEQIRQKITEIETSLTTAKTAASQAVAAANQASVEANEKIIAARKLGDEASVQAAREAYEKAQRLRQEAMNAQKEVDKLIKELNQAEQDLYASAPAAE